MLRRFLLSLGLVLMCMTLVLVRPHSELSQPSSSDERVVPVAALVPAPGDRWEMVRAEVPAGQAEQWLEDKRSDGAVAARPGRVRALGTDPMLSRQWGYERVAADRAGPEGKYGSGVVVAVIDTGVDASHPEFSGRILTGKDFVPKKAGQGDGRSDPNGHGTHVAGVIAAQVGNDEGIAGIAPKVSILPVRVLDHNGWGDDAQVAEGVLWAVDNGADILNLSLGTHDPNPLLLKSVEYAASKGVLVVAAAGNDGRGGPTSYPAAWPDALAVAATTPMDSVATFSTTGTYVDIAAPGSLVLSTVPGGYGTMSGTSMATPHVAAAAALLMATGRDADQARQRLLSTAVDLAPTGADEFTGRGLLDPAAALGLEPIAPPGSGPAPPALPNPTLPSPGQPQLPELPSLPRPELPAPPALPDPQLPNPTLPSPGQPQRPTPGMPSLPDPQRPGVTPPSSTSVRLVVLPQPRPVGQRWRVVARVEGRLLTARIECADGWFRVEQVKAGRVDFRPWVDRTHTRCQVIAGPAMSALFTLRALPRE